MSRHRFSPPQAVGVPSRSRDRTVVLGLAAMVLLISAAMVVPRVFDWDVRIGFPPVFAQWEPRVGLGTPAVVALAVLGIAYGRSVAGRLSWAGLLLATWAVSLGWLAALALVDGRAGISIHNDTDDYLRVARRVHDISAFLHGFIDHIPLGAGHYPTHVAGHPPGALLFFLALSRIGLGGSLAVGLVVTLIASTIVVAVLCTLRTLDAESAARRAAPFLVLGPAAIWEAVSGDAVFTAVAAWGLAALALAATRRSWRWSVTSGLLLGACVLMSYGLPLLAFLAIAVLAAARSYRPLLPAAGGALAVVAVFWVTGFSLLAAYPAIHDRYWAGVASQRSAGYWLWGDLAALGFSAGPAVGALVCCWFGSVRDSRTRPVAPGSVHLDSVAADPVAADSSARVVRLLGGGAIACVAAADLSLMSKAEVERIWLPFVPWLLVLTALLPAKWQRPALAIQVLGAVAIQHLFQTGW